MVTLVLAAGGTGEEVIMLWAIFLHILLEQPYVPYVHTYLTLAGNSWSFVVAVDFVKRSIISP